MALLKEQTTIGNLTLRQKGDFGFGNGQMIVIVTGNKVPAAWFAAGYGATTYSAN